MLGFMIYGMGLQKFFKGLLKPAMNLVGIFELWGITLSLLFLPTALKLLDLFLPLMDFLISLPDPIKEIIGNFALLGVGIGGLLFLVGMFTLGLGSLALAWGTITTVVLPFLAGLALVVIAVVAIIGYWRNWENMSDKLKLTIKLVILAIGLLAIAIGAPFIAIIAAVTAAIMIGIDIYK